MAFNISMENTIKLRKAEQAKIHNSGQLFTEIIDVVTSQLRTPPGLDFEEHVPADNSLGKKEEIDLLEKALEKAMQVRSDSKLSVTRLNAVKPPGPQKEQVAATKDALNTCKGLTKSTFVSKTTDQKDQQKYQTAVCHTRTKQADGLKSVRTKDPKIPQGNGTSNTLKALPDQGQHTLPYGSKKQMMKSAQLLCSNITDLNSFVSLSKTMESENNCLFQQEELLKWTNLKHKENRLWDKIIAFETKSSTSERDFFMARMMGTFPMRRPCGGSPGKIQAMVNQLIQQGQDLPKDKQIEGVMARWTLGNSTKREWESWDRWRPEWGCLCPIGIESEWHEGRPAPLPKTVTYTTERELADLELLRMRVALLQQEAFIEKILSDALSPHLCSSACSTLNPSLLKDLYSVLGEGGERFPAIVLDSEPDS